jgi:hypothetical protein
MIAVSSTAMLDQGAAMTAIALVLARIAPTVAPCVEACRNFGMLGRVLINLRRCSLRSDTDRHCATAANVAMGHVWTAPGWQEESSLCSNGRSSHVFGLFARYS